MLDVPTVHGHPICQVDHPGVNPGIDPGISPGVSPGVSPGLGFVIVGVLALAVAFLAGTPMVAETGGLV
jgi:hypothetical protein